MNTPNPRLESARCARLLTLCAVLASITVLLMFGIFAAAGIGQDPLQYVHPAAEYARILLRNPPVLRLVIGLDNLFIVFYCTMFMALGSLLWRSGRPRLLVGAALGLLSLSGLLDLAENMHFLTMLSAAVQGLEIGATEIGLQVLESLVKFHVSYFGLFLLGWVLPGETRLEKALCFALRWVQLPVGLAIYLVPAGLAVPLVITRFAFFVLALWALALVFRMRESGSGAPV
ncbi:MAG: hypothetical protein HYX47_09915 [Burkholderiales bacterium]|nr:hypothetical protein [Burkholderiales bacterium]